MHTECQKQTTAKGFTNFKIVSQANADDFTMELDAMTFSGQISFVLLNVVS